MTTHVERPPVLQFVGGFIVTALIFPLDAARFHWSPAYAEYERTVRYRLIPNVW